VISRDHLPFRNIYRKAERKKSETKEPKVEGNSRILIA